MFTKKNDIETFGNKVLKMAAFGTKKGYYKCPNCSKKWTSNVVRTGNKPGITLKKCKACQTLIGPYKLVSF